MNKVKLGDVMTFQRGYDLKHSQMKGGKIPVVGSINQKERPSECPSRNGGGQHRRNGGQYRRNTHKKLVFYSEPQFWYNINKRFAIGTEIKLSYNFYWWTSNFKAYPTLGVKCNFKT
jgi:hypothetical protein